MMRLAMRIVAAAVVLTPAVSLAQKPVTRIVPCDAACKRQKCTDEGLDHAKAVCGSATSARMYECILRNQRKYITECMRH